MEDYIHSFELQEYLQDSYYTVREERYVLPVKAQYRPEFLESFMVRAELGPLSMWSRKPWWEPITNSCCFMRKWNVRLSASCWIAPKGF